jgi:hypothetical protein
MDKETLIKICLEIFEKFKAQNFKPSADLTKFVSGLCDSWLHDPPPVDKIDEEARQKTLSFLSLSQFHDFGRWMPPAPTLWYDLEELKDKLTKLSDVDFRQRVVDSREEELEKRKCRERLEHSWVDKDGNRRLHKTFDPQCRVVDDKGRLVSSQKTTSEKEPTEAKRERLFGAFFPNELMDDPVLNSTTKVVWCKLFQYAKPKDAKRVVEPKTRVSYGRVARDIGVKSLAVLKAVSELEARGWLLVEGRKGQTSMITLHYRRKPPMNGDIDG